MEVDEIAEKIVGLLRGKDIDEVIKIMEVVAKKLGWEVEHKKGYVEWGPVWKYLLVKIGYFVEGCRK